MFTPWEELSHQSRTFWLAGGRGGKEAYEKHEKEMLKLMGLLKKC